MFNIILGKRKSRRGHLKVKTKRRKRMIYSIAQVFADNHLVATSSYLHPPLVEDVWYCSMFKACLHYLVLFFFLYQTLYAIMPKIFSRSNLKKTKVYFSVCLLFNHTARLVYIVNSTSTLQQFLRYVGGRLMWLLFSPYYFKYGSLSRLKLILLWDACSPGVQITPNGLEHFRENKTSLM